MWEFTKRNSTPLNCLHVPSIASIFTLLSELLFILLISAVHFFQKAPWPKAKRIKVLLTKVIQPRVRRLFKSTLCILQPSKRQAGSNTASTGSLLFSLIQIIIWNNVIMFSMFSPYLYQCHHQEKGAKIQLLKVCILLFLRSFLLKCLLIGLFYPRFLF